LVLGVWHCDIHSFGGSGAFGDAFGGGFEAFEALGAMIELWSGFPSERLDRGMSGAASLSNEVRTILNGNNIKESAFSKAARK
jgi:hypothetical protein